MGGMAGIYVGLSGLQTSSNSLNTTANNLSNVNTDGYVRQQIVNKDLAYTYVGTTSGTTTGKNGLGVTVAKVNHVRDIFLDAAYRKENGRNGFYEKMYESLYEIETQMGESEFITGIGFQNNITDFLEALHEVAKTPGDVTARSALVQSASQFIDSAQTIYKGLVNYQNNLNEEIKEVVARINEIGETLVDLNRRISKIETGGYEIAADLRDARDLLLDELSSYCKITVNEEDSGAVSVMMEGVMFANQLGYTKMGLEQIPGTTFVNPIWPALDNQSVYNFKGTISTALNTDIGGLKGLLVARGLMTPTYENVDAPEPDVADYMTAEYPTGEDNPKYISAMNEYEQYTLSKDTSTLVNVIANFDKLVSTMVTEINDILCPETTITAADGTVYTVLDIDKSSVTNDGEVGYELFTRGYCDRYKIQTIDGVEYYVRNDINSFGNASSYTIMNLSVNENILRDYSRIPLTKRDGSEDYEKAKELVDKFSADLLTYNGSHDILTFEEFYESMVNDVANTGKIYKSMQENEQELTNQLDSQRLEIMGVSSDEELSNMIRFQQAYNASSRYINVVSEMIETLIMNLGVG